MEWLKYLLILICPLMMLFCMKGHSHNTHGHHHGSNSTNDLDEKIRKLEKENEMLKENVTELNNLVKNQK